MRSAQDTTSPSGVLGAGRDHEWFRIPSSVSAHRFTGSSTTSAPQHGVVEAARRAYGVNASSLACPNGPCPQS